MYAADAEKASEAVQQGNGGIQFDEETFKIRKRPQNEHV